MSKSKERKLKKKKAKEKAEFKSPIDWYVACVLIRLEWQDENLENPNRRCLAWENQILVKARNPEEAYTKAMEHGKAEEVGEVWNSENKERKASWRFEGLTSLLAIYDRFEDGSEITWREHENKSVRKIKSRVRSKEELEVFDRE